MTEPALYEDSISRLQNLLVPTTKPNEGS